MSYTGYVALKKQQVDETAKRNVATAGNGKVRDPEAMDVNGEEAPRQ